MSADCPVVLVGEMNPYGADPYFALYPEPTGCAGWRLCCRIFGMHRAAYLRVFQRRNLLAQARWSVPAARTAAEFMRQEIGVACVVLLGRKVWEAWRPCLGWRPFTIDRERPAQPVLALPHPSGLCRMWSEPDAIERARAALRELAPWLTSEIGATDNVGGSR